MKTVSIRPADKRVISFVSLVLVLQLTPAFSARASEAETKETLWKLYGEALSTENYGQAESLARRLIDLGKSDHDDCLAYIQGPVLLANAYAAAGEFTQSENLFQNLLASAHGEHRSTREIEYALENLAGLYRLTHDEQKLASTYRQIAELEGANAGVALLTREADACFRSGDFKQSERIYEQIKAKSPIFNVPNLRLAECYERNEKLDAAESELKLLLDRKDLTKAARMQALLVLLTVEKKLKHEDEAHKLECEAAKVNSGKISTPSAAPEANNDIPGGINDMRWLNEYKHQLEIQIGGSVSDLSRIAGGHINVIVQGDGTVTKHPFQPMDLANSAASERLLLAIGALKMPALPSGCQSLPLELQGDHIIRLMELSRQKKPIPAG